MGKRKNADRMEGMENDSEEELAQLSSDQDDSMEVNLLTTVSPHHTINLSICVGKYGRFKCG
jgi:hypothetical protein